MKRHLMAGVLVLGAVAGPAAAAGYVGREFPGFTAVDAISDEAFSLADLRGKAVIVDFWATWCAPCRRQLPHLKRVYEEFHDQGLEVVGISLDRTESAFRTYVEKSGLNWRHVMEGDGWRSRLAALYRVRSIPRVFVLDRNGICVADNARGRNLEVAVRQALATVPDGSVADPVTQALMRRLVTAHNAVQRTLPPLESVLKRLDRFESSLHFNPNPGSERIARGLERRVAMLRDRLQHMHETLYRYGVVDGRHDPDLMLDPPDLAAMRAAAGRMRAACESARAQLAWAGDGLVRLQREVMDGTRSSETLDREISVLHDHAMQLAATWCGSG